MFANQRRNIKQKHQKHSFYVSLATKYLNRVNSVDSSYSTTSPSEQAKPEQASHFHLKEREEDEETQRGKTIF